jgi:hypothetical protein
MVDVGLPEPDYSPIMVRKPQKPQPAKPKPKKIKSTKSNLELWGNADRYRGSLEELDQESSPDDSQGSSFRVRDMAEKLKKQTERDRRRQIQRQRQSQAGTSDNPTQF